MNYIKDIVANHPEIEKIIVGLPHDLYGNDTRQLDKTLQFIDKLREVFPDQEIV